MTTAAVAVASTAKPSKALNVSLWIVQVLLAAAFIMAGLMKSTTPIAELAAKMVWPGELPGLVRFIGVSELLGGVGLLLPALTRIKPQLTALAGAALALVMVLAAGFHVMRGEWSALPINLVLGGLAAFVAWGRFRGAPIAPR